MISGLAVVISATLLGVPSAVAPANPALGAGPCAAAGAKYQASAWICHDGTLFIQRDARGQKTDKREMITAAWTGEWGHEFSRLGMADQSRCDRNS